jgi:hypothetical protein
VQLPPHIYVRKVTHLEEHLAQYSGNADAFNVEAATVWQELTQARTPDCRN